MNIYSIFRNLFLAAALAVLCSSASAAETTLTFGVVPQFDSRKLSSIWTPILEEVGKRAGVKFQLVGSASIPRFEKEFVEGKFDLAYMNPYHLLVANNKQGYVPIARDTERMLYGIIVVRKDSPLKSIKELAGQLIAFPAPNALGASLMPRAEFKTVHGFDVVPKYVRSHSSVYLNVVLRQTVAGGGVQKTLEQQPENIRDALRVIHETEKVVPHPISVHPRIPEALQQKIQKAFLELGETESGAELLSKVPMRKIGPATLKDYEPLAKLGLENFYEHPVEDGDSSVEVKTLTIPPRAVLTNPSGASPQTPSAE